MGLFRSLHEASAYRRGSRPSLRPPPLQSILDPVEADVGVGHPFCIRVILFLPMMNTQRTLGLVVGLVVVAAAAGVAAFMKPAARPRPAQMNATQTSSTMPTPAVVSSTTTTVAQPEPEKPTPAKPTPPKPATPVAPTVTSYTAADVAIHNTEADCWSSINGNVYNLSAWIAEHPGGERSILRLCGKDGSAAFNGQHGGQGQPMQTLSGFKVGTLK